jgi:hypothetical protein
MQAAARASDGFNEAVLTLQRKRRGGKQVVKVVHQQVAVAEGGQAIVAGGGIRSRKRRGLSDGRRDQNRPATL